MGCNSSKILKNGELKNAELKNAELKNKLLHVNTFTNVEIINKPNKPKNDFYKTFDTVFII